MNRFKSTITSGLMILCAAAQAPEESLTIEGRSPVAYINHGDLNLADANGIRALNRRVERAAWQLCSEHGARRLDIIAILGTRSCRRGAVASARGQIDQAIAQAGATRLARRENVAVIVRR